MRARDNPFRTDRIETFRYRWLEGDWETLLCRLEGMDFRGAIVGPPGAGKTTLLEDLAVRLRNEGRCTRWLQLHRNSRENPARLVAGLLEMSAPGDILLVDGVEQLGAWHWNRLRRRSEAIAGLVVTSHTAGRLPTLVQCRSNFQILEMLVAELAPGDVERLRSHLPRIFAQQQGNIRLCLRQLYDRYANGACPADA